MTPVLFLLVFFWAIAAILLTGALYQCCREDEGINMVSRRKKLRMKQARLRKAHKKEYQISAQIKELNQQLTKKRQEFIDHRRHKSRLAKGVDITTHKVNQRITRRNLRKKDADMSRLLVPEQRGHETAIRMPAVGSDVDMPSEASDSAYTTQRRYASSSSLFHQPLLRDSRQESDANEDVMTPAAGYKGRFLEYVRMKLDTPDPSSTRVANFPDKSLQRARSSSSKQSKRRSAGSRRTFSPPPKSTSSRVARSETHNNTRRSRSEATVRDVRRSVNARESTHTRKPSDPRTHVSPYAVDSPRHSTRRHPASEPLGRKRLSRRSLSYDTARRSGHRPARKYYNYTQSTPPERDDVLVGDPDGWTPSAVLSPEGVVDTSSVEMWEDEEKGVRLYSKTNPRSAPSKHPQGSALRGGIISDSDSDAVWNVSRPTLSRNLMVRAADSNAPPSPELLSSDDRGGAASPHTIELTTADFTSAGHENGIFVSPNSARLPAHRGLLKHFSPPSAETQASKPHAFLPPHSATSDTSSTQPTEQSLYDSTAVRDTETTPTRTTTTSQPARTRTKLMANLFSDTEVETAAELEDSNSTLTHTTNHSTGGAGGAGVNGGGGGGVDGGVRAMQAVARLDSRLGGLTGQEIDKIMSPRTTARHKSRSYPRLTDTHSTAHTHSTTHSHSSTTNDTPGDDEDECTRCGEVIRTLFPPQDASQEQCDQLRGDEQEYRALGLCHKCWDMAVRDSQDEGPELVYSSEISSDEGSSFEDNDKHTHSGSHERNRDNGRSDVSDTSHVIVNVNGADSGHTAVNTHPLTARNVTLSGMKSSTLASSGSGVGGGKKGHDDLVMEQKEMALPHPGDSETVSRPPKEGIVPLSKGGNVSQDLVEVDVRKTVESCGGDTTSRGILTQSSGQNMRKSSSRPRKMVSFAPSAHHSQRRNDSVDEIMVEPDGGGGDGVKSIDDASPLISDRHTTTTGACEVDLDEGESTDGLLAELGSFVEDSATSDVGDMTDSLLAY